jgi:hypothetical protein
LLKKLSKKDPYIRFLRDTHEANKCEERICFYDSLTRATFTLCFQCYKTKLKVWIKESVYFSKSEQLRLCQLQQNLLPFLVSIIKEHPTFRIKLILKEYTIDEYAVDKLHFYSFKYLLDREFHFFDHYLFVFPFSLLAFIMLLVTFYVVITHLSSLLLYITAIPLFFVLVLLGLLVGHGFSSLSSALTQHNHVKKIEELEKSLR